MSLHLLRRISKEITKVRWIQTTSTQFAKQPLRKAPKFTLPVYTIAGYALLIIPATCFYLAVWQIKRKKWKEDLIKDIFDRFNSEPVPLPENLDDLQDMELCPIKVRGHFDYTREVYLGPRSHEMPGDMRNRVTGFHVVTPFKLADRDMTILVNRGWYSKEDCLNPEIRKKGQVHGEIELVGIVRHDQAYSAIHTFFADPDKPDTHHGILVYVYRRLNNLAKVCNASPVFLDAKEGKMAPFAPLGVAKPATDLRNEHLNYAITWLTLGSILTIGWVHKLRKPPSASAIMRYSQQKEMRQKRITELEEKIARKRARS